MLSLDEMIVELIVIARLGFVASKSPSVDHMKLSVPVCVGTAFIPTSQTLSFYLTRLPSFKQPKPCQSLHPNRLFCQIHFPEVVIHMILPRKNEKNGNYIEIYLVFWVVSFWALAKRSLFVDLMFVYLTLSQRHNGGIYVILGETHQEVSLMVLAGWGLEWWATRFAGKVVWWSRPRRWYESGEQGHVVRGFFRKHMVRCLREAPELVFVIG